MSEYGEKPVVLHLAVDYPNVYRPENTLAVRNFVRAQDELDHFVVAMTRTANPLRVEHTGGDGQGDGDVLSMRYWGLPFGMFLGLSMFIAAWRIRREILRRKIRPDLIHAHKLAFEGLAGWWLSRWLRVPLVLSVRGESESKVLRYKPLYRPLLQRVLNDAKRVYYVSAWFRPILTRHFRIAESKQRLLPNFVNAGDPTQRKPAITPNRLLTILDLNVYRKKGLDRLLPAFRACLAQFPSARLDIVGRGSPEVIAEVRQLIARHGLEREVSLLGVVRNEALQALLPAYAGMVLASHNETFGMVYVEALLAGVPILHSRGTGIDGFVDFVEARVAVDPKDERSIAEGLIRLLERQQSFRDWLERHRDRVRAEFDRKRYVGEYRAMARGTA